MYQGTRLPKFSKDIRPPLYSRYLSRISVLVCGYNLWTSYWLGFKHYDMCAVNQVLERSAHTILMSKIIIFTKTINHHRFYKLPFLDSDQKHVLQWVNLDPSCPNYCHDM
jgi:hypothetical protein